MDNGDKKFIVRRTIHNTDGSISGNEMEYYCKTLREAKRYYKMFLLNVKEGEEYELIDASER